VADKHVQWQDAKVVGRTEVAEGIVRLDLEPASPVSPRPGEHIDVAVALPDGRPDTRSYSISGASADGSRIAISVSTPGVSRGGSEYMRSRHAGDALRITEPLQDFPLRIGASSYVLVAGGVGITAIRGMASVLKRLGADYTLHYIGSSRERMAYLDALTRAHGDRLVAHVTSEHGRMQVHDLLASTPADAELYMCGPIRLMEAIKREWDASDRDPTSLRFETFGNSGWFAPEPFEVSVPRLGVTVQVQPGESMLEALERGGVDMMYDCRRGECGLCEVYIGELDGEVDHRDVFYSERQKAPNAKMCCCVSRVASGESGKPARVVVDVT
jgi:vanillate O-demethylase ferredoxin subunit